MSEHSLIVDEMPRPDVLRGTLKFLTPYFFLLPTLIIFGLFSLFPLVCGGFMSLYRIDMVNGKWLFIALDNYSRLLRDPVFGQSVLNTFWYAIAVVPGTLIASLAVALFLRESRPARLVARLGFYIPFVLSPVVVATSWKWLLNEDFGVVDDLLRVLGLSSIPWLTSQFPARFSVVVTTVWNLVGFYMLMFLAGLSQIRGELYEAAKIEGASVLQRFYYVTLPMLRPTILLVVVLTTVDSVQAFESILLLTDGGPANSTRLIVQNMYDAAFLHLNPGYGVAQAILLLPVILFIAWIQMRMLKSEGEG